MNAIELLAWQTENAYGWANKLITSIPFEKWETIPANVESNITWQAGHLVMSNYYHSIMVIAGHQPDVAPTIPLREYNEWFTDAAPEKSVGKTSPETLLAQLTFVQQKSLTIIRALNPEDLGHPLEPTRMPHPIARTKLEAVDWNIKHTFYHCGQIGLIKRVVDTRYDFGLRKNQ